MSDAIPLESVPVTLGETDASPAEVGYDPKYLGLLYECLSLMLPDSIRFVASITKLFTATAILRLNELGKLDDHVSVYLPEFDTDMHRDITITHLLTHTSGLRADPGYYLEPYSFGPARGSGAGWLKRVLEGPLQSRPGEKWAYSSIRYLVLGAAIERITGEDYEDYVTRTILEPLGLERTCFRPSTKLRGELCVSSAGQDADLPRVFDPVREPGPPRSAGGLQSCPYDLWRFGQCLLNGGELEGARVLGRKSVEAIGRNQLSGVPAMYWGTWYEAYPYGLGAQIRKNEFTGPGSFAHEGSGASCLFMDPSNEIVAVYFSPSESGWTPEAVDNPLPIIWAGILRGVEP